MDILFSVFLTFVNVISIIVNFIYNLVVPQKKPDYPPIRSKILTKSVTELVTELRNRKLTSVEIVQAYVTRIKEVNPSLNAVIEDRFDQAIRDAERADTMIASTSDENLLKLFMKYPLLGIPFTVKESCGLKGHSYAVGSAYRLRERCTEEGETVTALRTAGCIPLLISANPEFCLSFETNTQINGRCCNPYDLRRSSAGSSGGEGALNGSGATPFGLGSDIAGSIRLPSLFCGVFGHKPTGGLVSIEGHFPISTKNPEFAFYLQLGPITRFARDLPILLGIMAGKNRDKLKFDQPMPLRDIKIYYMHGFTGINRLFYQPTAFDIKLAITRAVKCFESIGMTAVKADIKNFDDLAEICLKAIADLDGIPSILTQSVLKKPSKKTLVGEICKSLIGHSPFTREALAMELMQQVIYQTSCDQTAQWREKLELLQTELLELLGDNGVLFMPSFHKPAFHHNISLFNFVGVAQMTIFNILGFPATQIPMGLDEKGLPIGFQVIAAPYQDKLCLQIAAELEGAFGGWIPAKEHKF